MRRPSIVCSVVLTLSVAIGCTPDESPTNEDALSADPSDSRPVTATAGLSSSDQSGQDPSTTASPLPQSAPEGAVADSNYLDLWRRLQETESISRAAIEALTNQCMVRQGFQFSYPEEVDLSDTYAGERSIRIWNTPNESDARLVGYQNPQLIDSTQLPDEESYSPEYEAALTGRVVGSFTADGSVPPGFVEAGDVYDGCLPVARTAVVGEGDPSLAFVLGDHSIWLQQLRNRSITETISDERWVVAEAAWSECMSESGYDYESFDGPILDSWPAPRPTPSETETALADWGCKQALGVPLLGDQIFDELFAAALESEQQAIRQLITDLDAISDRSIATIESVE